MKRILIQTKGLLLSVFCCMSVFVCWGQNTLSALDNMHPVSKGETWESVAADYGVSVSELQAANPDISSKKLKKGKLLIIPQKPQPAPAVEVPEEPASVIRTVFSDLKVGVLLPFSDKNMLEFYRGLLMAADSVRKNGVNLDIYTWDCGTTTEQIEQLLPQISGLDVLFGPTSATQIPPVAEVCKEQGIRLVLPYWSGQPLLDYPLVYNASAPNTVLYDAAVKNMMRYYGDKNFIIVRSGDADVQGKMLSEALAKELAQRSGTFRVLELEGDDFAYESAFNQFRDNMILIDGSSVRALNILLARLKDFRQKHSEYRLSMIGYPEWQDETQRLLGDFFAFDTFIIRPYYYNVLAGRTKQFEYAYTKNFRTPIVQSNPCHAALGFDLGCYFLGGISSLGDTFEQMQGSLNQEPYQNWYRFERSTSGMSFFNNFVLFVHFTPEKKIELIR